MTESTRTTYSWYRTPVGFVTIAASARGITALGFGCIEVPGARRVASPATTAAANQVLEYLAGKRRAFDFPVDMQGGEFQLRVWDAVRSIAYGETLTASGVAQRLGMEGAHRSVGAAIKANPLALVVPDHRIVTPAGKPHGVGAAAERRAWLLRFEQLQVAKSGDAE